MSRVGESVFHSVHGLGVVEAIEEKHIQGKRARFSVVNFHGLTVMVNLEHAGGLLRAPVSLSQAEQVLEYLGTPPEGPPPAGPPGQIYQGQMSDLRSGDIYKLCDLLRTLTATARARKLTPQQQDLGARARALLVQELAHVRGQAASVVEDLVSQRLALIQEEADYPGVEAVEPPSPGPGDEP